MIDALRKLSWHIYDHDALPDGMGWQQLADTIAEAAGAMEGMMEEAEYAHAGHADIVAALDEEIAQLTFERDSARTALAEHTSASDALLRRAYVALSELAQVAEVRQHLDSVGEAYLIEHIREAIK